MDCDETCVWGRLFRDVEQQQRAEREETQGELYEADGDFVYLLRHPHGECGSAGR